MPYPHHLHPAGGSVRCCITPPPRRPGFQLIEIILLKNEIYHDIDEETHILQQTLGKALPAGAQEITTIATDDTSRYLMDRYIDRCVSQAVSLLSPYLAIPSPFAHRIANNHTKSWQEKSILLSLPKRWPPHLIEPLRDAVHRLIVKGTEKEILSPVLGPAGSYVRLCEQEAEDAAADISVNINTRYGPMSSIMP